MEKKYPSCPRAKRLNASRQADVSTTTLTAAKVVRSVVFIQKMKMMKTNTH